MDSHLRTSPYILLETVLCSQKEVLLVFLFLVPINKLPKILSSHLPKDCSRITKIYLFNSRILQELTDLSKNS